MGDQDIGSPGRPVSSGLQVPGEPGHCRAKQDHLGDLPAAFFLQDVLQFHQQICVILRVVSLTLWKIINEKNAVFIPKKIEARTFSTNFCTRKFLGRCDPLCRHSIDYCFVSGS